MTEKPILFSGAMVQAILAGNKTQTRRIVKPQPSSVEYWLHGERSHKFDGVCSLRDEKGSGWTISCGKFKSFYGLPARREIIGGPVLPADRLWVRETFRCHYCIDDNMEHIFYRADGQEKTCCKHCGDYYSKWKRSIHMPRNASRLTLEITAVRVERLQDISEEDACHEGVIIGQVETGVEHDGMKEYMPESPTDAYIRLWESINGEGSWKANPWVWVIEFRKL